MIYYWYSGSLTCSVRVCYGLISWYHEIRGWGIARPQQVYEHFVCSNNISFMYGVLLFQVMLYCLMTLLVGRTRRNKVRTIFMKCSDMFRMNVTVSINVIGFKSSSQHLNILELVLSIVEGVCKGFIECKVFSLWFLSRLR